MAPDPTAPHPIVVHGNAILPNGPSLPKDASGTNYILIRTLDELTEENLKVLMDHKVDLLWKLGDNVSLCKYLPSDLKKLQSLGFVESALVYDESLKVRSGLKNGNAEDAVNISVVLFDFDLATTTRITNRIKTELNPDIIKGLDGVINFKTVRKNLAQIAKHDEVRAIEENLAIGTHNNVSAVIMGVGRSNEAAFTNKYPRIAALTGAGSVIAICDTGVDTNHAAFAGHGTVVHRAKYGPFTDDDVDGHGTHVAATALGRTASAGGTFLNITGIAPGAGLYAQKFLLLSNQENVDLYNKYSLFDEPAKDHAGSANIHSNSWGPTVHQDSNQPVYGAHDAQQLDRAAHDNPNVLYIFSAGNDGEVTAPAAQIGSYASAKNVLTVGACYSQRPIKAMTIHNVNYKERYDTAGAVSNPDRVAPFSSKGPPLPAGNNEQRVKPDVIAPGASILSARSSTCRPEILTKHLQASGDVPADANQFLFMSGTSMAAPAVAGMAALLREALRSNDNKIAAVPPESITSALLKAIIINSAGTLLGFPETRQGYGRVNMEKALTIVREGWFYSGEYGFMGNPIEIERFFPVATGVAHNQVQFPPNQRNLKVAMVYIDNDGMAIQDQIKLIVHARTGTQGAADRVELGMDPKTNVQQAFLINLAVGQRFTIRAQRAGGYRGSTYFAFAWYCG
ncbi:MAG: hypothetical protein M1840_007349 [Geoglossum simile]|nr:MAG: hypothetical protein M1840_007349 [Geoglossum simile]